MTDEHDEASEPVSPEDETRLRALLSDARESGATPDDVVARLDDTLAGLVAERLAEEPEPTPATGSEASIHPLVRTRRHRVVAVLGAAAAVAVLGLGIGALLDQGSDDAGDSAATDAGVERGVHADADSGAAKAQPSESLETADELAAYEKIVLAPRASTVRSPHLTRDLARIQAAYLSSPGSARYGKTLIHEPKGFTCADAVWGRGVLVAARYDGAPAYVAFRQPMGDSQVVEVLQCGTAEVLRSTTLPTDG
ncbi:hypothetical protein [Nocardioides sp. MH1]|uniref:hypothetical protein n=1 Tax=Nocardioides sp. MH1 TaxID=3242490 RepID=UPI00351F8E14